MGDAFEFLVRRNGRSYRVRLLTAARLRGYEVFDEDGRRQFAAYIPHALTPEALEREARKDIAERF
jgi:hypothetical protein